MDASREVQRFLRVYRAAKTARGVRLGHRKLKSMLDDHASQTDRLVDAAELVGRVQNREVRAEDVRAAGKAAVNSIPRVYQFVARHVRKNRENAET